MCLNYDLTQMIKDKKEGNMERNMVQSGKAKTPFYSDQEGNEILKNAITSGKPSLIARYGETELRTVYYVKEEPYKLNKLRRASYDICNNAGFFPRRLGTINRFANIYLQAAGQIDYLARFMWDYEDYIMTKYSASIKGSFKARILDMTHLESNWVDSLEGKKVLIISPFASSIVKQYEKRDKLFVGDNKSLPVFELKVIKAVQSIGGKGVEGYKTWFEALQYMENLIKKEDFEVALLGCGSYGLPLAAYVKQLGKTAIYMGGCLQLMFGIMGNRWEKFPDVMRYYNEFWTRPSEDEMPKRYKNVENGCYW